MFKRHMGETFSHFLNRKRMDHAKELLADFRLSIAEVSCQAGYEDANYFSRRFQRATGQTPSTWRKNHSAGNPPLPGEKEKQSKTA